MESIFKPPEPLHLDGNISDNWRKFEQQFQIFIEATELDQKSEAKQLAVLLNLVGNDGLDLYNSFTLTEAERKSLKSVLKKFAEYCSPKKNVIFERYRFNSIVQKEGQTFDNFLTELRKGVKTTDYKEQDDMVRDRIVMGIANKNTQERLLREEALTLQKAVDFCRATEASQVKHSPRSYKMRCVPVPSTK
ncbi:uncharacterized protein LOC116159695 [Photinus pyralis]|uniref:uncharacterized protein LOC116159695 n=1 Tax=Photinus pyralis TaxID=7054 RepID=UPI0012672B3A|nr:uncharacterized protein LOC116159695 [Photinus pyralis]